MAYGIEEIAEMQLTGPVKGGDMVMKPDQAPVGAAALLNKMQKKNTPGIFKLPEVDKEMPAFMKVAAEGVEEQNTANLENQEIMRIMGQYGVGPEEAKRMYDEMIYGYERDEAAVDPSDWRTILRILEAGGDPGTETETANLWQTWQKIKDRLGQDAADQWLATQEEQTAAMKFPGNFTERGQNVTELPRNLKTGPDNPETELAYITDDEKALLAFMKPGTPHEGPEGIPTYDEEDYNYNKELPSVTYTPSAWAQSKMDENKKEEKKPMTHAEQMQQMAQGMQEVGLSGVGDVISSDKKEAQKIIDYYQDREKKGQSGMGEGLADVFAQTGLVQGGELSFGDTTTGRNIMGEIVRDVITGQEDPEDHKFFNDMVDEINKWKKADTKLEGLGLTSIIQALMGGPYKEGSNKLLREVGEGEEDERTLEGLKKKLKELGGNEGMEMLKRLRPELFYKFTTTGTSGMVEDLSKQKTAKKDDKGDYYLDGRKLSKDDAERYNRQVFEARETFSKEKGDHGQKRGGGRPAEQVTETETEVTENITPDERAGSWNLGGTMPYSDDLYTQGTEIDVPLGRRFEIDKDRRYLASDRTKDDIYKYATEGGYSQLEPFANYLARRRKHLGEQPDEWFDEEGNVIYSNTATV